MGPTHFTIEGRDVSKSFTAAFSPGVPDIGANQAKEVMGLLFRSRTWRELHTTDVSGGQKQVFFNPDCSKKDGKLRATCRRFIKELRSNVWVFDENTDIGYRASDGRIFVDRAPLAQISVTPDNVDVKWLPRTVEHYGIDKDNFTSSFLSRFALQWIS